MANLEQMKIAGVYLCMAGMYLACLALQMSEKPFNGISLTNQRRVLRQLPSQLPGESDVEIAPGAGADVAPFRQIYSLSDWKAALAQDRAMIYVDCDWNVEVAIARKHFFEFAAMSKEVPVYRLCWSGETASESPLADEVSAFWKSNGIHPGGMKNLNGAGYFVWLEKGRAVANHYAPIPPANKLAAKTAEVFN